MLSWGVVFIVIVASMVFGISYYGYNNIEYLSKADWLVVSSGLATLLGTVLSGITAIYGFLNKKEMERLKERLVVYDLTDEVKLAKELRAFLATEADFILEKTKGGTVNKKELDDKFYAIFMAFSKVKSISKMKKYKKLENKAKHNKILNDLTKDYIVKIKKLEIPKKSNLYYIVEILVEIEHFGKKGE